MKMNESEDVISSLIGVYFKNKFSPLLIFIILDCYPHLIETILCHLDSRSLASAERVSKKWRKAVLQQKIWKKTLLPKVYLMSLLKN